MMRYDVKPHVKDIKGLKILIDIVDSIETVGKALFFNISALRSKLNMAQHNDLVGIIILEVSI